MLLEALHDLEQLGVASGVEPGEVVEPEGVPDAGNHVFALGAGEVVAIDRPSAGGRVSGEADPGAGVLTQVAEHHHLDIGRCSQIVWYRVDAPVLDGSFGVPGMEHRLDRPFQLLDWVLGELTRAVLLDDGLEPPGGRLQITGAELGIVDDARRFPQLGQNILELRCIDPEDDVAIHLDEAPVDIPGEMRVA